MGLRAIPDDEQWAVDVCAQRFEELDYLWVAN
jgi:hypothetical protein